MKLKMMLLGLVTSLGLIAQTFPIPQPATSPYPTSVLQAYPTYDRASYQAATGKQAPPFNPALPPKAWFDPISTIGSNTYNVLGADGQSFTTLTLPASQAGIVNLKGLPTYEPFIPVQTNIEAVGCVGCQAFPLGAGLQSTLAQAKALVAEIGDPSLKIRDLTVLGTGAAIGYTKINPNSDVSVYMVGDMNVGQSWGGRQSKGIGYPGSWNKVSDGEYDFAFDNLTDGTNSLLPDVKVPVRLLLPNEKFVTVSTGGLGFSSVMIARTDVDQQSTGAPSTGATSGGFTDADRAMLKELYHAITGK